MKCFVCGKEMFEVFDKRTKKIHGLFMALYLYAKGYEFSYSFKAGELEK